LKRKRKEFQVSINCADCWKGRYSQYSLIVQLETAGWSNNPPIIVHDKTCCSLVQLRVLTEDLAGRWGKSGELRPRLVSIWPWQKATTERRTTRS